MFFYVIWVLMSFCISTFTMENGVEVVENRGREIIIARNPLAGPHWHSDSDQDSNVSVQSEDLPIERGVAVNIDLQALERDHSLKTVCGTCCCCFFVVSTFLGSLYIAKVVKQ